MMLASKKILNYKTNKSVIINLGNGDLYRGFCAVTARVRTTGQIFPEQFTGSLPAAPALAGLYRYWQSIYQNLCNRTIVLSPSRDKDDELEISEAGITNVSEVSFNELCQKLQAELNAWLKSEGFLKVDRQLRSQLDSQEKILIIIESDDDLMRRLPWHRWDLIRDYPHSEVALSKTEYKRPQTSILREKVRILAILGNSKDIDLKTESQLLENLKDTESEFSIEPSRREFNERLWDPKGWDILFFAGHSKTKGNKGHIYINDNPTNNSLTLDELEEALKAAIANGLKLAIFNSCDGLGLADTLAGLNIPQVIVMREPVPNRVAQEFFRHFLEAFAEEQQPLYLAVQQSRRKLQGLEDEYPGASWLPVICQNPAVEPLTWQKMISQVPPCPYRGLSAFREKDAPWFFGREEITKKLSIALKQKPIVAVIGASGSGKSSVVFAGVIPYLQATGGVKIVSFRPQNQPFASLTIALGASLDSETPTTLSETFNYIVRSNPDRRLVLVADQFEELYTLCSAWERQSFLDELLLAVKEVPNFTLVLTMRADFYDAALSYRPLSDALQDAAYNLGPMNEEELQRAISKPAALAGVSLENGLTQRLIAAVAGQPGRLPLLEFTLTRLWSQQQNGCLTHQSYEQIGGVEKALANHAEAIYTGFDKEEREQTKRIFIQLVQLGEGSEATRRVATRDRIKNWDLVTKLASARLVVTSHRKASDRFETNNPEETVEIIHEALISAWERLKSWLRENEDFLRWQSRLENALRQWESHERKPGYLLSEAPLVEAETWLHSCKDELSASQLEFIDRSIEHRDEKLKQEKHRQRFTFSLLTGSLVTVSLWAGVAWWQWQRSVINEVQALNESSRAFSLSHQNLEALIASIKANKHLDKAVLSPAALRTQAKEQLSKVLSHIQERNRLEGHENWIWDVSFSPDGQTIASASRDNNVKLWKRDGSLLHTLKGHTAVVKSVSFSPDGQTLVSASYDRTIKLWRTRDGALLDILQGHNAEVYAVGFSPDGQTIASASADWTLKLWCARDGILLRTLKGHKSDVNDVSFSPDGQTLVSASDDRTLKFWQVKDGSLLKTIEGHKDLILAVSFSPDGQTIASASIDSTIKLWRKNDGALVHVLRGHPTGVYDVNFSPDGQTIASAGWDSTVKLWNSQGGTELHTFQGHNDGTLAVSFSPDGKTIASASADRTIRLWKKIDSPLLYTFKGHSAGVLGVSFSPDGETIASTSADRTIRLWQTRDGSLLHTFEGHSADVYAVSFSPDNQTIVSASADRTLKLWSARDGSLLHNFKGHKSDVMSVSFSPDGQTIVSASLDRTIKLWRARGGFLLHTLKGHGAEVFDVNFSPDGQTIVSASADRTLKLWSIRDGSLIRTFQNLAELYAVSFSPDGETIASGSSNGTIQLWRTKDAFLFRSFKGHSSWITDINFSPDGEKIASTGADKTVKLWDSRGEKIVDLRGHDNTVLSFGFSANSQTLVSASLDNTFKLWRLNNITKQTEGLNELLETSCDWLHDYFKANPNVSRQQRQSCS